MRSDNSNFASQISGGIVNVNNTATGNVTLTNTSNTIATLNVNSGTGTALPGALTATTNVNVAAGASFGAAVRPRTRRPPSTSIT